MNNIKLFIIKLFRKLFKNRDNEVVVYNTVARDESFREYLRKTVKSLQTGVNLLSDTQRHYLEALFVEGYSSSTSLDVVYDGYKKLKGRPNDWHLVHLSAGLYHLYIYKTGEKPKR